jgi:hypothetical protein
MRLRRILPCVGQAETSQRRIEHLDSAVEDELAFNAHPQFAAAFFELPRVQPAIRRQAQIDAVVVGQVLRLLWWGASRNTTGRRQPPYAYPVRYALRSYPLPLAHRISRQRQVPRAVKARPARVFHSRRINLLQIARFLR